MQDLKMQDWKIKNVNARNMLLCTKIAVAYAHAVNHTYYWLVNCENSVPVLMIDIIWFFIIVF